MLDAGKINNAVAKEVFEKVFKEDCDPVAYIKEKGLESVNDTDELEKACRKAIEDNPQSVADYKAGKTKAAGFLVGQVMKATRGKGNPGVINQMITRMLNEQQ